MKKILLISVIIINLTTYLYAANPSMPQKLSSKAFIIIPDVTKKQILDVLTNEMISRGFKVKSITEYNAIYSKIDENQRDWVIFGINPESRISYDIVETAFGIKIVATQEMISNPNTAKEYTTDFSYYENVIAVQMEMLTRLKKSLCPTKL